jgi:hypothetical protein
MGAVEVYVVRIYRRFPDDPEHVEGIVETPGSREAFAFRLRDELMKLVFPGDTPKQKTRKPARTAGKRVTPKTKRRPA